MIVSAIATGALLALGLTIPQVLLVAGIANAVVAVCLCLMVPEYFVRFVAFVARVGVMGHKPGNNLDSQSSR